MVLIIMHREVVGLFRWRKLENSRKFVFISLAPVTTLSVLFMAHGNSLNPRD